MELTADKMSFKKHIKQEIKWRTLVKIWGMTITGPQNS